MLQHSTIQFLKNEEIDKKLWDECIANSSNGLIYAKSFYLDNMCRGWSALVEENYNWVLPVTQRTKWGITYLYQPSFTQQLGIFAKPNIIIPYKEILECLQKFSVFWEVSWNYATPVKMLSATFEITTASNFVLNLRNDYKSISSNYFNDLKNNLKLCERRFHHIYRATEDYNKIIQLYKLLYAQRLPMIKQKDYKLFEQLCSKEQGKVVCREVVNKDDEVLASVLLLQDGNRLYNIMNSTTDKGRTMKANHFLLDRVIYEFSGREILFDFEGSDVPGVKAFYKNFGAVDQHFFRIKYNNLPWPLRHLKK